MRKGGITPAGAGKTRILRGLSALRQDHPRRCGENVYQLAPPCLCRGSPPQVRGKQRGSTWTAQVTGITPAGAGKTSSAASSLIPHQGSPPQVRGKHKEGLIFVSRDRITPAGAGKTSSSASFSPSSPDHPRRCGENAVTLPAEISWTGSPPQVRGKLYLLSICAATMRITPAGAGKTCRGLAMMRSAGDHPRRCGENTKTAATDFTCLGSPPQVRGKLVEPLGCLPFFGITPAGAGKTRNIGVLDALN